MKPVRPEIDWQDVRSKLTRAAASSDEALSPSAESIRAILAERARLLARVPAAPPSATEALTVVTFALGNERYAVESRFLREVVRVTDITPVPDTPEFLAGVTNVRGEILALVDLRKLFGIAVTGLTDLSRIVILGLERAEFGLLADAVHEVTILRRDDLLEPPGPVAGISPDYSLGVTEDALIVLDGEALLVDPRLFVGFGADRTGREGETP
jgi:purine-binding chemotaxis protein CheW